MKQQVNHYMQKANALKLAANFKSFTQNKPTVKEEEKEITVFKHENKQPNQD
jgi:hypothetical protein